MLRFQKIHYLASVLTLLLLVGPSQVVGQVEITIVGPGWLRQAPKEAEYCEESNRCNPNTFQDGTFRTRWILDDNTVRLKCYCVECYDREEDCYDNDPLHFFESNSTTGGGYRTDYSGYIIWTDITNYIADWNIDCPFS